MASQLKNILNFVGVLPNTPTSLPHGLNWSGLPRIPDFVIPDDSGWNITADAVNVTVESPIGGNVDVLVESWHTLERAFGDDAITSLSPQPFVAGDSSETPPFSPTTTTIYARTTGNDHTGKGTLAKPYATFQRAIRDVPNIPAPGANYVIDITGITEALPAGYQMPVIQPSGPGGFFGQSSPAPWYSYGGGVTVTATPELFAAIPAADAVISATDLATVAPAGGAAGLIAIHLGTGRASWNSPPNALKGAFLVRSLKSGTSNFTTCAIYGSDANNIYVANDAVALNGGLGMLNLAPGEKLLIVQPSATFTGSIFQCWGCAAPNFQGINFASGLDLANAFIPVTELCTIAGSFFANTGNGIEVNGCNLTTSVVLQPAPTVFSRCLFSQMSGNPLNFYFAAFLQTFFDCVFDNTCPTLTNGYFLTPLPNNWGLQNVLFQGSQGDAIYANAGPWVLANVEIDNSVAANGLPGNAITIDSGIAGSLGGGASMVLTNVKGTGNAAHGLAVNDGAEVRITDTITNPTGAVGQDLLVGDLPVRTWIKFYGVAPIGQQYDITAVGATGATGTGSRVYQR